MKRVFVLGLKIMRYKLVLLVLAISLGSCSNKQDFPELRSISKIEILVQSGLKNKITSRVVTDPSQIASFVKFVNSQRHGFEPPFSGGPHPRVRADFYASFSREIFGIQKDYHGHKYLFSAHIDNQVYSKGVSEENFNEFLKLAGVKEIGQNEYGFMVSTDRPN